MTKRRRRFVAWLGIVGIVFAQIAVAAHACMVGVDGARSIAAAAAPHDGHCSGHEAPAPVAPQGNACELACSDGAPTPTAPDLPPLAFSTLPIAAAPLSAVPIETRAYGRSLLAANSAAPPIALSFCRLLI
jgi:hypothetical protein